MQMDGVGPGQSNRSRRKRSRQKIGYGLWAMGYGRNALATPAPREPHHCLFAKGRSRAVRLKPKAQSLKPRGA